MSDMEKEKITLLACPFCGGEAEIVQDWIRCIKCGVWTDVPKEEDGLPKSIQAWNTRAKQVDERQETSRLWEENRQLVKDKKDLMANLDGLRADHCESKIKHGVVVSELKLELSERQELDVDAVEKMIVNSNHACCMYLKDLAQAIVNTFKPKVEKKSIKELQDKLVKFFSIESLTLNESTIVHLVAMISQHSYYADKPKVEDKAPSRELRVAERLRNEKNI